MLDTVHWWLPSTYFEDVEVKHLSNVTEHLKSDGQRYRTAKLDNYRLRISDHGISLKGSLCKYYFGNNCETLTWYDSLQSIKKLEDHLHISLNEAIISRLDFAQNLMVRHKPKSYYHYLGDSHYFKREPIKHSLYWKNCTRVKVLYNKIEEVEDNGETPPLSWKGENIARFEVRYLNRVSARLRRTVKGRTFNDQSFFMQLADNWKKEYDSIHKLKDHKLDLCKIETPKDFNHVLMSLGMEYLGGYHEALRLIENNDFKRPEYRSRAKSKLNEVAQGISHESASELILELDDLIKKSKYNYL